MDEKNLHAGHRKRMRNRYLEGGLDAMDDHQVLEMLLSFAIPRRDTNELGHVLLREFGSLSAVFEAPVDQLQSVDGIGLQAAILLSMLPQLMRRYLQDRIGPRPRLSSSELAGEYASTLFIGEHVEVLYLLCLDTQCRLLRAVKLQEGTLDSVPIYPRYVVEQALRWKAKNIILTHNHPAGSLQPSRADIQVTQDILTAFDGMDIHFLDHLIVGREGFFSFVQNNVLQRGFTGNMRYAAEDPE